MTVRRRRFWNPVGITFAAVFASGGATFAILAAVAAGWIVGPAGDGGPASGFGPVGAGLVAVAFLVLAGRCNLWVDVSDREVVVRGVLRAVRLVRDATLEAGLEFRTRPTGLRLSRGDRSVTVYPRPRGTETLLRQISSRN